jgi:hypothetical protein
MGPSLRLEDLELLQNEITFGCNKVYLAFENIAWRPTYYTVSDIHVAENNYENIDNLNLFKIFPNCVKPFFPAPKYPILWLREPKHPMQDGRHKIVFSRDICRGVYGGWTVIYVQLQLAFSMGIREVYLIGIDFSFTIPEVSGEQGPYGDVLISEGEINHFHPDYRKPGERWSVPQLDRQRDAFIFAKNVFEEHGGVIYNASRETALDVFPRVDLDLVVKNN